MSDDVLSIVPTDARWRPARAAGDRTAALVAELIPEDESGDQPEMDVDWHDDPAFVDCGESLERVGCPLCGAGLDLDWWGDVMDDLDEEGEGFADLSVRVPCCDGRTSLDVLSYEAPCAFARFEISVWNPARRELTGAELAELGAALGHPVRQILARI